MKKLKKQKGSGAARYGDIKNPVFRGGGRIFGPRPRYYGFKLNKKVKQVAIKSVLSSSVKAEKLLVLEDLKFEAPKTKDFTSLLENLNMSFEKILVVTAGNNKNVYLSARNIPGTKVVSADSLNTYDILNANKVVIAEGSVEMIEKILN